MKKQQYQRGLLGEYIDDLLIKSCKSNDANKADQPLGPAKSGEER